MKNELLQQLVAAYKKLDSENEELKKKIPKPKEKASPKVNKGGITTDENGIPSYTYYASGWCTAFGRGFTEIAEDLDSRIDEAQKKYVNVLESYFELSKREIDY